jgi:hypothetical protein
MIRLRRDDFNDPHELAKFAATAGLSLQEFRREFEYLVHYEPPPLHLDAGMKGFLETEEDTTAPPTDPVEEAEHSHARSKRKA